MRTIDVARRAGCSVQQVRRLEAIGVLPDAPRTGSGYRAYGEVHVASIVAYQSLVDAAGPAQARAIMFAVHHNEQDFLARLDAAHAQLAQERGGLAIATRALHDIGNEPMTDVLPSDHLTIGELALALEIRPSTLRHWEAERLLSPARGKHGARTFSPHDVRDARLIQQLRQAAYRIPQVRDLLPQLRDAEPAALALSQRAGTLDERSRAFLRAAAALETVQTHTRPS